MRDDDHVANFGDATAVGGDFRGTTQPGTRGAAECWHLRHDTNTIHETTPDVPPFSAALSIPPSALPKITRRVPETEVFLKLARVARGLDLLQQMRRRRGPGSELLAQSYEVAKKKAKQNPLHAPTLTLVSAALSSDSRTGEVISKMHRETWCELQEASVELNKFAELNMWTAETMRDEALTATLGNKFAKLAFLQKILAKRIELALVGTDPANFSPSAARLVTETFGDFGESGSDTGNRGNDGNPGNACARVDATRVCAISLNAKKAPRRFSTKKKDTKTQTFSGEALDDVDDGKKQKKNPPPPESNQGGRRNPLHDPTCVSQSELLTSSQRDALGEDLFTGRGSIDDAASVHERLDERLVDSSDDTEDSDDSGTKIPGKVKRGKLDCVQLGGGIKETQTQSEET
jgi:hypothetical protein|tara:strand:- start:1239 stop:2456 length:1218 start_codon:yes stop_codon:yes gene_type:complete